MTQRVAQVGAFLKTSRADAARWLQAELWLKANGYPMDDLDHDVVNLRYGRDFLAEDLEYDYVVVHNPFNPDLFTPQRRRNKPLIYRASNYSPLHSTQRWRDRLAATRAAVMFLFETDWPAVTSRTLGGPILGYRTIEDLPFVTAYVRLSGRIDGSEITQ